MSNSRSNIITPKATRTNSIPSKTTTNNQLNKRKQITNVVPPRKAKKEQQIKNNNQKIKVDYNSSNYFYSNENENNINSNNNDDEGYVEYYDNNQKSQKYNRETSDSYITVEQEDGNFKSVPNYYIEYNNKRNSPYYKKDDYEYYEENSEYDNEEGIENDEMYYENDEEYEQEEIDEQQSPKNNYRQYQNINNYYTAQNKKDNNNNKKIKIQKVNQNVISRPIHHQVNYQNDTKRKSRTSGRLNNYGNNSTTTNNTYNNNIYYINPINVKDKNIKGENQRSKRQNKGKNLVYKNVDITINKSKKNNEKDFFRLHNIDKSQRINYIKSAILIQSLFRAYLVKMKMFNSINLYISVKGGVNLLEKFFLRKKSFVWKKFKNYIDVLINLDLLKHILINNSARNNSTDKKHISFHKEIGDSFNIINKKDNSEIKLKSKLNDVIKENNQLKTQLVDNKNIEEKMKNLIDENKKNQNINAIIMKDNQQLAKKLKDFQDYRNTNLKVENQTPLDLTQKDLFEIDELIKNNEIYKNKLKEIYLANVINKRINENKYLKKDAFNRLKNAIEKIKNEDKEKNLKKNLYLKNFVNIISNNLKITKLNCFKNLYYASILSFLEKQKKQELRNKLLNNILIKKRKNILLKAFIKIYYNKFTLEKQKEKKSNEEIKRKLLKKIVNNYDINRISILKTFTEKWSLKSKIIGIREAARDKKRKRKLKKKNNKLISQKHFGSIGKNQENKNNLTNKLCKSIHEFSYIVSNGAIIKESSSNEPTEINIKNNKYSISSDKINKKFDKDKNKNHGIKKINSVNEINIQNNIKKEPKENIKEKINSNAEESDEDSGDSLGLGNNSD